MIKARRVARVARRRVRLDIDERRAQLLGFARQAFAERAYDDVSIDDLAQAAKISKGLLYHYFPTKRDLYVSSLQLIADELVQAVTAMPDDLAPIERVRRGLDAYLEHIEKHARAFVSLMRGGIGSDPEVAEVIEGVRRRLFESFLAGTPFAPMLRGDARFELSIRGWIGFVEAVTIDHCANPRLTRPALVELLGEILAKILPMITPKLFKPSP